MDDMVQLLSGFGEPTSSPWRPRYAVAPASPTLFTPNLSVAGAFAQMQIPSIAQHPAFPRHFVSMEGGERVNGLNGLGASYARAHLRGFGDDVVDTTLPAPIVAPGLDGSSGIDGKSVFVGGALALLGAYVWRHRKHFKKMLRPSRR